MAVSPFALGAMTLGSVGNPDHDDCVRIVRTALEGGINFVDTADMYSAGESEVIVGKALTGCRDDVVLATKGHFGLAEGPNRSGNSRRYLTRAVEGACAGSALTTLTSIRYIAPTGTPTSRRPWGS